MGAHVCYVYKGISSLEGVYPFIYFDWSESITFHQVRYVLIRAFPNGGKTQSGKDMKMKSKCDPV